MNNDERGVHGERAMQVGAPDYSQNDDRTNAVDTIANVLHAIATTRPEHDARSILDSALMHYLAEVVDNPALRALRCNVSGKVESGEAEPITELKYAKDQRVRSPDGTLGTVLEVLSGRPPLVRILWDDGVKNLWDADDPSIAPE